MKAWLEKLEKTSRHSTFCVGSPCWFVNVSKEASCNLAKTDYFTKD